MPKEIKLLKSKCFKCNKIFSFYKTDQKGKFCSYKCYWKNLKSWKKELASAWKGNKVGYGALHCYIKKLFGKPVQCEHCGIKNKNVTYKKSNKIEKRSRVQWANKSGKYLRDRNDWLQLCPKCHAKYDKRWLKRVRNNKGQFI